MKRFRLSTLMTMIVIAALCICLAVQHQRAAQREAALQARLAVSWPVYVKQQKMQKLMQEAALWDRKLVETIARREAGNVQAE
jgi:hypothetical protein